ncbi:MAG: sulfurtransferase TusA family protein, partial [Nitrospirae bacterium]
TLKFLDKPIKADASTDVVHMMCPMHLLNIQKGMMDIKIGQVLSILTDYDGALVDIPEWCDFTGNELIGVFEHDDYYEFFIKKCREMP